MFKDIQWKDTISQWGKFLALLALLATVNGWASCNSGVWTMNVGQAIICDCQSCMNTEYCRNSNCPNNYIDGYYYTNGENKQKEQRICNNPNGSCAAQAISYNCLYHVRCTSSRDLDSLACNADTSKVWNNEVEPPTCDDKVTPQPCSYCEEYTSQTFPFVVKSRNWECTECSTNPTTGATVANGCTLIRDSEGTCDQNNDCPSGMICNDSTPNVDCYATVGATVYLRDRKNNHVWACKADGDCQSALRRYSEGDCQDPNPTPNSSNSANSSDSGNSSDSNQSSSSETGLSSSGAADGPWALEETLKLNTAYAQKTAENTGDIADYTVTIMGKTSDIYNELIEQGITLNNIKDNTDDIKTNTGATATNVGSIDNKLNRTNNLLDSINKKNWNPHIDVQPPEVTVNVQGDTNSVTVNVDTSHAPSEILGFLRGLFGVDTSGWDGDTSGWNGITDSAQTSFDSAMVKSDWLRSLNCDTAGGRKCDDKILGAHALDSATARLKSAYKGIGDTLKNGAFGDSLSNWGSKFTGNNVITGSGSNSCPSVLTRSYHVEIIQGAGFDMTLGTYLCNPIFGNLTAWTLCRLLLRATIALACMWFLFRCATGFRGQGGDDD